MLVRRRGEFLAEINGSPGREDFFVESSRSSSAGTNLPHMSKPSITSNPAAGRASAAQHDPRAELQAAKRRTKRVANGATQSAARKPARPQARAVAAESPLAIPDAKGRKAGSEPGTTRGKRRHGARSTARPVTGDSAQAPQSREDWVQMSFRAPPIVEQFISVLCRRRDVTFQTLMLRHLRSLGAPVGEDDLLDNRKGPKVKRPAAARPTDPTPAVPGSDPTALLDQLCDPGLWKRVAEQSGKHAAGLPGTVQIIFANFAGGAAKQP